MRENRAKRIMKSGGMALGVHVGQLADPQVVEIIGLAGYDAARIDMEHTSFDLSTVNAMITAAENVGITPIVRTPGFDPALILRLLDMGAQGIQVPHVRGAEGAREAVKAVRYAPLGERGMSGHTRPAKFGSMPFADYMEAANREILLMVMIEDLQALEENEEIAAVDGVDVVSIGPDDLAASLGVLGQNSHPVFIDAFNRIVDAVKRGGKAKIQFTAGQSYYPLTLAELRDKGVGYVNCSPSPEVRLMRSMSAEVQAIRKEIESL